MFIFFIVLWAMFIIFGLKSVIKQSLDLVYGFLTFGSADKSYLDIDNSAYHKSTSSNNCLICGLK